MELKFCVNFLFEVVSVCLIVTAKVIGSNYLSCSAQGVVGVFVCCMSPKYALGIHALFLCKEAHTFTGRC